jgi:soluble cytochrome b562
LNASLLVGAEKEALMAARGRETTEQLQEMLKSAAKAQDEMRRQQSSTEASASDYAHKCDVLAASLRDSQAHCRDLEKQIESSLSKVAHGHEAVRRLQDELVTKSVEVSTEQFQSRDLRSQIDSLVEDHKRQNEVLIFKECSFVREILTFVFCRRPTEHLARYAFFKSLTERNLLLFLAKFASIMTLYGQAIEDLRIERDRRSRLEEALRSARVCVRCGHPRVFVSGDC